MSHSDWQRAHFEGSRGNGADIGTCAVCGKLNYLSRKVARGVAKRRYPGAHVTAYRCGDFWHIGAMPPEVRQGRGKGWRRHRDHPSGGLTRA